MENAVESPKFILSLALKSDIVTNKQLADKIIESSENISVASCVSLDGKEVASVDCEELDVYLNELYLKAAPAGTEGKTDFVEDVKIEQGYYLTSDIKNISVVKSALSKLTVKAVVVVESDIETDYKTVTNVDKTQPAGYKRITTEGKKGLNHVVDTVTYIGGQEVSRVRNSETVISEPIECVMVVGGASSKKNNNNSTVAKNAGFIFPLPKGSWRYSAGYGDGRGHKGVDLSAPAGTSIYAVKAGKVVKAGWYTTYGYCVIIDHGNGLSTLYGHASALCVKVGDNVNAGDVMATVGRTGNATGYH
ncbi:MAG: peptidoglycan DD-metalloendopeptidase family protein [Clostridia bacterium]|nr:peptidoglycan DD-metalloendopeptidase family protein [Clostridia bacterium]